MTNERAKEFAGDGSAAARVRSDHETNPTVGSLLRLVLLSRAARSACGVDGGWRWNWERRHLVGS